MKKIIFFGLVFLVLLGCYNSKKSILGKWYYIRNDLYHELYVSDTNYIIMNIPDGLVRYKYEFNGDTLYTYLHRNELHKIGIQRIITKNKWELIISGSDTIVFNRITYDNAKKKDEDQNELYSSFTERAINFVE